MIERLKLEGFRNFNTLEMDFSPRINLICGENGSGKTSVLEAIYVLGNGKSFRTNRADNLIANGMSQTSVYGQVRNQDRVQSIGFQRTAGTSGFRVQGEDKVSRSTMARVFPTLALSPASHEFLELGPQIRRKYLDWGVFHVEHKFGTLWAEYHRCLKQRNSILLGRSGLSGIESWEAGLAEKGEELDLQRRSYLNELQSHLKRFGSILLPQTDISFDYRRGQPDNRDLLGILEQSRQSDLRMGYTQYGPHRADVAVSFGNKRAGEVVSRGQQKLLVYIFVLAQIKLLQEKTHKTVSLLLDDLGAELDKKRLTLLIELLNSEFTQIFITSTQPDILSSHQMSGSALFHVEHGRLSTTQRF